ncbi:FtsX-like permease family protein [Nocardioides marmoriginsengisoli]|uniref:FtsX-like permease family protein n=1 Tax=Nocardioides marmoriginsengisoli TaxID=661483 RepID=A0A3N0CAA0_9ACTN|nr:ABC transporter permease [Nocardioides marmoriginsengisoli]RNL60388.1 FtsX-like permease family protein [Nocardioides marmoriginsengisoli]
MFKLILRNVGARKMRLAMSALAIVLGVAFLSGVLVFSAGLSKTFDGIIQGTTPDGVVRVEGAESFTAGETGVSAATVTPDTVARLAALPEVDRADGNVDGFGMYVVDSDGDLLGGTGAPTLAFNRTEAPNMDGNNILTLLDGRWGKGAGEIVLDEGSAEKAGYSLGDSVKLLTPAGQLERTATLVGTAEFNGGGTAGATLIIFDTPGAQEVFLGGRDVFTTVALTAADGVSQSELVKAAKAVLPAGFEAVPGDQVVKESEDAMAQFLDVIKTFLLVFALIAVIVGAFIIVNTFSILVAQRTRESALLRALGASRRQVTSAILAEAFVMALFASTVGIGLGWALARGLAAMFSSFGLDIEGSFLNLTTATVVTSYTVGILVTLVAALLPARRAGRVAPVAAMREDTVPAKGSLRRRSVIGSIVIAVSVAAAIAGLAGVDGMPAAAWVGIGAFLSLLTVAVLSPVIGFPVLVACRAVFGRLFGASGRLAGENAMRDPRRTGATASALMIGLALVSTIAVMAGSMKASVDTVVDEQFAPDFIAQSVIFAPFSTQVGDRMEQVDGVATVSRQQMLDAKVDGHNETIGAADANFDDVSKLEAGEGSVDFGAGKAIINEDKAEEEGWKVGDTLKLAFPGGKKLSIQIGGIIRENSVVVFGINVPLEVVEQAGIQRQDNALSIVLDDGADPAAVHRALDRVAKPIPLIEVNDKEGFAESIRGQVNQLLYMIYGLLALAIIIAIIGIVNTLGLSVLERTREIGLLRAIGMTRRQLRRTITLESVAIAVLGAVLGMALGLIYGTLLQRVLKEDLTVLSIPFSQLLVFGLIAVVVGVLAAVMPAVRASRLNVLNAISTE